MASRTAPAGPGAQVVGNAFVKQYYHILHQSPESVYKFYQDSSVMSRPEPNGDMTTVTTMQAINDQIVSLGYKDMKAEIKTADAQDSHNGGVIVLVTGCLTGEDNVKRKFTQTFFLAPQDVGYFILNDVFRYMDKYESVKVLEDEITVVNGVPESKSSQKDAPKNSYASIVKVTKERTGTSLVSIPMTMVSAAPANTETEPIVPPAPASWPAVPSPWNNTNSDGSNIHEEAEGFSIYIRGLPLSATVSELEEEFKKFGPIKPGGIQVRSKRQQGFCFGFVEFELSSSMQSAIEASPINFRGVQAGIEEKRTTTRRGRGGFRNNDDFRGCENFNGRGYGRNDYGNWGEFSGCGWGPSGCGGTGYQRVDQNGNFGGRGYGFDIKLQLSSSVWDEYPWPRKWATDELEDNSEW